MEINKKYKRTFYDKYVKRCIDFILSLLAVIVLSPVLVVTAILVKTKLGSPVIFKQERPGLNEKVFKMYKFRTMTDERDENGELLPDEIRLTKFGKALRATSLDEIPELLNILKGDMSIVGPRPQLVRDMVFMSEEQRKRHLVRPGLTGWAQVSGRNNITWEEKFEYDLDYISNELSFAGDLKILFMTIGKVLKQEDIVREGTASDMDFGDWLLFQCKIDKEEYDRKQFEAKKMIENVL